jgi:hypothetical protein
MRRSGDIALTGIALVFRRKWDQRFESASLQRGVTSEPFSEHFARGALTVYGTVLIGGFVLDVHGSVPRARAYCKWFRPIADPLTLHQADQARADFAAKCISLICDAHIIPFPELQHR